MTWRLGRVAINVGDLAAATRFYAEVLGFSVVAAEAPARASAQLLGVAGARVVVMRRGRQDLELCACDPLGAPIPRDSRSNDVWFQHCALVSGSVEKDYARVRDFGVTAISRDGPVVLPGGIVAFKFRDLDYHPLELIAFPEPPAGTVGGIDHSAISVSDSVRSIAFYRERFGFGVVSRQVNHGGAQDALDDLDDVSVDVVALAGADDGPHVELLGYRSPVGRAMAMKAHDIAATRLVFIGAPRGAQALIRDPDGHFVETRES